MSSYNTWISIGGIIQDFINKSAHSGNLNEELIYIAAEEAVDQIVTGDNFGEYVVCLDLFNQKVELPANFKYPTQVAYRPTETDSCTKKQDLKRYFISTINNACIENVCLNACESCKQTTCCCETKEWYPIETTQNYVKLLKTPQLATGYSKFMYGVQSPMINNKQHVLSELPHTALAAKNRPYHERKVNRSHILPSFSRPNKCPEFQMVRPASNFFFNLPGILKHCNIPCYDTNLEYRIDDNIIFLNNYDYSCNKCQGCQKKEKCYNNPPIDSKGQVLISYLGTKIDEEGFLMIPNEKYIIKAVTDYIIAYMARIAYANKMDKKTKDYFLTMSQLAEISTIKARSRYRIPSPDKWKHFIENIWLKQRGYSDWKENLNRYETDQYRLPDQTYSTNQPHFSNSSSGSSWFC